MAQRTVCLCDGKYIGIESIFTVINGQQINIPEKLKELRAKSQNNELYCPCGCGANLILVAGDRNLREQHFRLKDATFESECHVVTEGKTSVNSKIVLKCWLDDKLQTGDVETRVPISHIGNTDRKYEFSFLSRAKKVAVSYSHERVNLSDEKFDILQANSDGIKLIYIVDIMNSGSNGQYPEALMKIQDRQGFCLLLDVEEASYTDAKMYAVFYAQDNDGLWKEIRFAEGPLSDFAIAENGSLMYKNGELSSLLAVKSNSFEKALQEELLWREEEKKRREEELKQRQEAAERRRIELLKQQEEAEKERKKRQEEARIRREKEEAERRAEMKRREDDFRKNMADNFTQQHTQVRDAEGNRWIKCEYCGLIAKENEFTSYGGTNHVNLGTCKSCSSKQSSERISMVVTPEVERKPMQIKYDASVCPECGGKLREKNGQYGSFIGCSNYPKCRYTRKIRKF